MSFAVVKVTGSLTILSDIRLRQRQRHILGFMMKFHSFKSAIIYSSYVRQLLGVFHKIFNRFSIEKFC